jgi:hypothetical protein
MPNTWEPVPELSSPPYRIVHRLEVPGGWLVSSQSVQFEEWPVFESDLVRVETTTRNERGWLIKAASVGFCPDHRHEWQIPETPSNWGMYVANDNSTPPFSPVAPQFFFRHNVPGGWLVAVIVSGSYGELMSGCVFCPDSGHEWTNDNSRPPANPTEG